MIEPTDKEVIESLQSVIRMLGADNERLRQDAANANKLLSEIHITKDEEALYSTYGEPDWIARRDAQLK